MRRKYAQPALPNLFFRDGILSVPGYTFEQAVPWNDTGSITLLAEGMSLKDGSSVLAKIAAAHTNGSMCLEREAHILERLGTSTEGSSISLRMIDFFTIPKNNGDCIVLLLIHPGQNVLGRYFPPSKVNDLLLADLTRPRPPPSHGDVYLLGSEDPEYLEDMEPMEIMDLATFIEFAIQATKALQMIHSAGLIHREVRANAFHLNSHSGLVRLVHFGNRAVSLEQFGVPSTFVLRSDDFEEAQKLKVKEALCYLAPEQTGGMESISEDHRTDLYALGVLFWTLLVGRGVLPFEGGPLELLHSIVQKRPMPVHEVRRDVPQVLAMIIDKLLAKAPDLRYQSAHGLMADLQQCQARLLTSVSVATEQTSSELIPYFDICTQDRYTDFTIPSSLFGREKELETIRNVIRHASTSYSRQLGTSNGSFVVSSSASHVTGTADDAESGSSKSDNIMSPSSSNMPVAGAGASSPVPMHGGMGQYASGSQSGWTPATSLMSGVGGSQGLESAQSQLSGSDMLRRAALGPSSRRARTHAVIVVGPPGAGKSTLILAQQAKWRSHGLWGQAKFQDSEPAPFATLLSCMSSVLRQLIVFHTDLHRFVTTLRARLGPQLQNVPLLYEGVPELKDILALFNISLDIPQEALETHELRARFEALVETVFAVLSETRLFALFLDDLQDAPDSSLDLIRALVNSRSRTLIFGTVRSDNVEVLDKLRSMFTSRAATWITLEPLSFSAVSSLVSRTLRRSKEETQTLSRMLYAASLGNAFSLRNILMTLQRQGVIMYDWQLNNWKYDLKVIETNLAQKRLETDPNDISFLVAQLRELHEDAQKYLIWASFFGASFKVTDVALMMDWEDSSGSSSGDDSDEQWLVPSARTTDPMASTARGSMRGLQMAIQEGWLVQRARDMCSFTHDRFRQTAQAEAFALPEGVIAKMSFRIILMMLQENLDIYRIAEHAKRCLPLLREHQKRDELLNLSIDAGDAARARGAHELALQSYSNALSLLDDDPWHTSFSRTMELYLKMAELSTWKGEYQRSNVYVEECLSQAASKDIKAQILRIRARNQFMKGNYAVALNDTIEGLHLLGVEVNPSPTRDEADTMFEQVKDEILAIGFDEILKIPRARDARADLAIALLNDAGTNAYWSTGEGFADVIGLTTIRLALRSGMCPGTALGFFWALGAAAERRELYQFSADLGRLALRLADQYGSSHEKCRSLLLYTPLVSGYDAIHIRANIPRLEDALKYGQSAGDRLYCSFASLHLISQRLYVCDHLSELIPAAEESLNDVSLWSQNGDLVAFCQSHLNCVRALAGQTLATSAETAFDTEDFNEKDYLAATTAQSGNLELTMNWYNSFKIAGLYCLGFSAAAAELGFSVYQTRDKHPNHRHVRYGLFFHSLALIECIRNGKLPQETHDSYMKQIEANQIYLRKWLAPSPVNNSTWIALVDAEVAALANSPDAFKLYDVAIGLAVNNDWLLEEGLGLFLQGTHFVRQGVEGLGTELQRRGISRQSQWGARGIVNHLSSLVAELSSPPFKRHIFASDVAVQTDAVVVSTSPSSTVAEEDIFLQSNKPPSAEEDAANKLTSADLASILRWSKEISRDINLSLALQSLTEIVTENSGSQSTCVVIAREAGDYTVATSMIPPEPCQVHENPIPIRAITDPLQRAAIQHALNTKARIFLEDVSSEPRFATEARESVHRSIICLPIFSNRGQTFGAVYLASKYAFSLNTVTMLTLLCEQASIGISNALLFRSVQTGTRENLKMIASQKEALEAARKSREDALKATKIKSNFLASMSHELRTPFSSFYGLLDILSGTELNMGQREIVATAKQSCELLLKIIDSILDYSKLEASALKLEFSSFPVENIIADCMELLLPMAAKKLDLSFNIEPDVPPWVTADYDRIRQVLMNLIGNAVKFTASGFIRVTCSVDRAMTSPTGEASLKFVIQDTGIGLSPSDVDLLFVPFQQADNSSTRRFGGTGLGLSISRQLVKLMGGAIGVQSELGKGSVFWFTIPVKVCESDESKEALSEMDRLKLQLMKPHALRVLVVSQSPATASLLGTMLSGFFVSSVSSTDEAREYLRDASTVHPPLDFILLDHQSEKRADELARFLHEIPADPLKDTKLLHLYTPTTDSLTGHSAFNSEIPGVVRMTKPPRRARLLHTLAILKNPGQTYTPVVGLGTQAEEQRALEQRTLFGNILIAEDNTVAQKLLIKQLERFDLHVIATSNGEEAINEWESHEPGYFSVALFDHHMPICDGVEACKRIRVLENKRRAPVLMPIVALSADCQESTKQLCLSAGMNAFLSKPLRRSDLVSLLCMFDTPPVLKPPDHDNTSNS